MNPFLWYVSAARYLVAAFILISMPPGVATAAESPGGIIRVWPLEGGAPAGADAFRVMYRSTGLEGQPIEVTGAIFIPQGPPPPGGRSIIAWAHPTSGVVESCAPSILPDIAGTVWDLPDMLRRGYVVAATDYPGLGTPGQHPYLIGESEGRAVIDSVRAARDLPEAGAGRRFAVWGHSQGGHAALYAGDLARSYAPELDLVGVAAAAPATELAALFEADFGSASGKVLTAMTLYSWSKLFNLSLDDIVEEDALPAFEKTARSCMESIGEFKLIERAEAPLRQEFLKADPTRVEAWRQIMDRNTPGREPAGVPVFLAQGTADATVPPEITGRFMEALCRHGARVDYNAYPGVTHTFIARDSARDAIAWMADRFARARAERLRKVTDADPGRLRVPHLDDV